MSFEKPIKSVMREASFNKTNTDNSSNNMSGRGSAYPAPDIVAKRFNWGAFIWTWIWGLGNNTYITLLIFATILTDWIPIVGWLISVGVCIWFGIKGNEWAWQNKHFDSVEDFHKYQKKWAMAGVILYCIVISLGIIGIIASLTMPALTTNTSEQHSRAAKLKAISTIAEVTTLNESREERCELSSIGIAKCFEKHMNGDRNSNIINAYDGSIWTFDGNGICKNNGDCNVTVDVNMGGKNDVISIPLYINSDGYLYVEKNDLAEFTK